MAPFCWGANIMQVDVDEYSVTLGSPWFRKGDLRGNNANLAMQFSQNRYMVGGVSKPITDLLTCTRASTAYAERLDGTLVEFGANELAITDKGVFAWEERTNGVHYSMDLYNGSTDWSAGLAYNGETIGPLEGTRVSSNGLDWHRTFGNTTSTPTTGEKTTVTCYFKFGDSNQLKMQGQTNSDIGVRYPSLVVIEDLTYTSNDSSVCAFTDIDVTTLPNGLIKITFVVEWTDTGFTELRTFGVGPNSAVSGEYVDVYGLQQEVGSFPTPMIKTAAGAATRNADKIEFSDLSWYDSEGTFVIDFDTGVDWGDQIHALVYSQASGRYFYNDAGSGVFTTNTAIWLNHGTLIAETSNRIAMAFGASGVSSSLNGGAIASGVIVISLQTQLFLGTGSANNYQLNAPIRSLTYYPDRLADAELIALTS